MTGGHEMKQIIILRDIKLKNKLKFYQNFFNIKNIEQCFKFHKLKQILSFAITSVLCFCFVKILPIYNLEIIYISLIWGILSFVELLGYSKSSSDYIYKSSNEYRLSSMRFMTFIYKTSVSHTIAEIYFKLPTLVPIIIFAFITSYKAGISAIIGGIIGIFIQILQIMKKTNQYSGKIYFSKLEALYNCIKNVLGIGILSVLAKMIIELTGTTLQIIKIMFHTINYNENILLNKLINSFENSIKDIKYFFINYNIIVFIIITFVLCISIYLIIKKYYFFYQNRIVTKANHNLCDKKMEKYKEKLPFAKFLYKDMFDNILIQIKNQPEIIFWIVIQVLLVHYSKNDIQKIIFSFWLFYIGNSNYLRSLFVYENNSFGNYTGIDIYYWKLSYKSFITLYDVKKDLLYNFSKHITVIQVIVTVICLMDLQNKSISILLIFLLIYLGGYIHKFNVVLSSFSDYFSFCNSYKAGNKTGKTDENEFIESKLYNLYKLPFTIIPIVILVANYVTPFLSFYIIFLIFVMYLLIGKIIVIQIKQFITKGAKILEKVHYID